MSVIYKKKGFIIVQCGNKRNRYFTVVNNNIECKGQHTHLSSFDEAKYVLFNAIKLKIPEDCSFYLQESIKRVSIPNYHSIKDKEHYETIYSKNYKTFCRKLNKKIKYYNSNNIKIIFLKLNPYGNVGYKAKVIKINNDKEYSNKSLWKKSNNDFWI